MRNTYLSCKTPLLVILMLMMHHIAFGSSFTAIASGKYSSAATWMGGIVPPTTVSVDAITILPGVTVDLDSDLKLNGATAQLDVQGTLTTTTANKLTMELGTLSGIGNISLKSVDLTSGTTFLFTGTMTADKLNVTSEFSTTADITVKDSLKMISGGLTIMPQGSLDMKDNTTIVMSDGIFTTAGGSVSFSGKYDVVYLNSATTSGIELTGATLDSVKLDLTTGEKLTLTTNVEMDGTLDLTSGSLDLGGKDLIINGDVKSTNGYVLSTSPSNIMLNTTYGTTGSLKFDSTGAVVQDFTINAGSGSEVKISGDLTVDRTLALMNGKLSFADGNLTLNGTMTGAGKFTGGSTSSLVINNTSGLGTTIDFSTGIQTLKDLTINTGATTDVNLASDLEIMGKLALMNGSVLTLGDNQLTIGTQGTITGTGVLSVNVESALKILAQADIDSLKLLGSLGKLSMQTTTGGIILGDHLIVLDSMILRGGKLDLNGYDLTVNGMLSTSPQTKLASTGSSDITLNTTVAPSGTISFDEYYKTVNNFTVNVTDGSTVKMGSGMQVEGSLTLTKGSVDIGTNTLSISPTATIVGADTDKYIIMDANGYLEMTVDANAGTEKIFPVGTVDYYSPAAVKLNGQTTAAMQVNVSKDVYDQGTTGNDLTTTSSAVDLTWHINSDVSTDLNMDLKLMWDGATEVNAFDKTQAYISHFYDGQWDVQAATTAGTELNGMFSMTRTGITSLSPFAVFDVNTVTGVDEAFGNEFSVYPNPATDRVSIRYDDFVGTPVSYQLYNANGQLITSDVIKAATTEVSVSDLMEGNYFIRFSGNGKEATQQLVKM